LDPVTWIEAALVSVTVRVTVCPEVMLFELALMETVGTAAEAMVAKNEIATKVRKRVREGIDFTGACLEGLVHVPDCALGGEVVPGMISSALRRVRNGRIQNRLMLSLPRKEATRELAQW